MNSSKRTNLSSSLLHNLKHIKNSVGNSTDLVFREVTIGEHTDHKIAVMYTDGLVDRAAIQDFILKLLTIDIRLLDIDFKETIFNNICDTIYETIMPEGQTKKITTYEEVFNGMLSGDTILLMNGVSTGLVISTRGWMVRGLGEPASEVVVQGPQEAFIETLRMNTALIRRRIKSEKLWFESRVLGTYTKTDIAICYIEDVVDPKLLKELHERLEHIDIDGIIDSSYVQQLISDSPHSIFPTIKMTERPDVVAASLIEGRIAIIVDGSPYALLFPISLLSLFQSAEDYYVNYQVASFNRILRFIASIFSLYTPALYIIVTTYAQDIVPLPLLLSVISQRMNVPFSTFMETIFLMFFFEIIYEAGIRMPKVVGTSVTIVGAIVLGDAAVQAGLVSTVSIIVIAIAAVSNFVIPYYLLTNTFRNLRFVFVIVAAIFGLAGIIVSTFMLIVHLCGIRSFGVSYLSPIVPSNFKNQQDTFLRMPLWQFNKRPLSLNPKKKVRDQNSRVRQPR